MSETALTQHLASVEELEEAEDGKMKEPTVSDRSATQINDKGR